MSDVLEKQVHVLETSQTPGPAHVLETSSSQVHVLETAAERGSPGLSAYSVALSAGFVGTVDEWIESLRGSSAYQIALQQGFVGSESEWLESLKVSVGVDVEDAGKLLTNDGQSSFWVSLEQKLNESSLSWDLGEI